MNPLEVIASKDVKEIQKIFKRPAFADKQAKAMKEYEVADHDVYDPTIRKATIATIGTGETRPGTDEEVTSQETIEPARIGMPFQGLIVDRRVGFMLTIPVSLKPVYETGSEKEKDLVKMIESILDDNKMEYLDKQIARIMMSELECAECWYFVKNTKRIGKTVPKFTLRCNIWAASKGDELFPMFNAFGDMIAFARKYELMEEDKKIEHYDVYTNDFEYSYAKREGEWVLEPLFDAETYEPIPNPNPNIIKKVKIIYHSQPKAEWDDVGAMISRIEESVSNHADMNDYFGAPILTVEGEVRGWSKKGEQGRILELMKDARANYLALNAPPESIKMEQENLKNSIMDLSQTPDISFKAMSGMGTIAQFTMKAFFMDAHMAVSKKEEVFGLGLRRRINLIKSCIALLIDTSFSAVVDSVRIKPVITPYLPQNDTEIIENLTVAKAGGIMSAETCVEQNPLVENSETELKRLAADEAKEIAEREVEIGSIGGKANNPSIKINKAS